MEGKCKIRKRGCSSSSSSSLVRRYRLKRAILVGRKAGSTTPVPARKPPRASPSSPPKKEVGGKGLPVSARKLGATLWEINKVARDEEEKVVDGRGSGQGTRRFSGGSSQLVPHLTDDPSQSPVTESNKDHWRRGCCNHSRRASAILQTERLGFDLMEVESSCHGKSRGSDAKKNCLKEVRDCLVASKELVKVLCRVGGLVKRTAPMLSLISALCVELDRARVQVESLMNEDWSRRGKVEEFLKKQFAEEKARWRFKERERVRKAVRQLAEEVEAERKLRRQTDRLNQKLGEELAGTKAGLYRMSKELQSERRTKEILQQVCDELSRGIGEDRAQVEELRKESAKVLEEVEKEREMLQLADILREERVQMKLSEAKYHFEEQNAVVEKLKDELEAYLSSKMNKDDDEGGGGSSKPEKLEELRAYLRAHDSEITKDTNAEENAGDAGDDSADSDLQSIELNVDNTTRSYRWSFINEEYDRDDVDEPRRSSVDRMFKGRKSLSDKINWESISLNRGAYDDDINVTNSKADSKSQGNPNRFDGRRLIDLFDQAKAKNKEEGPKKNNRPVKGWNDPASAISVASPVQKWSSSLPPDDGAKESGQETESIQD